MTRGDGLFAEAEGFVIDQRQVSLPRRLQLFLLLGLFDFLDLLVMLIDLQLGCLDLLLGLLEIDCADELHYFVLHLPCDIFLLLIS